MSDYYAKDGRPIDFWSFCQLFEDYEYRRLRTDVIGPYTVSTVWLGMNHNFFGEGPPLIFETMAFSADEWNDPERDGLRDMGCWRWSTEEEALKGHEEVLVTINATLQENIEEEHTREGRDEQ